MSLIWSLFAGVVIGTVVYRFARRPAEKMDREFKARLKEKYGEE